MGEEVINHEGNSIGNILTTQWTQTYPYNNKLPYVTENKRAYVGCTLIAMLQIMGYHKVNYKSVTTSDWTRFTQSSQCYEEKLQDCILSIFNETENKNVDANGTGVAQKSAQKFLNNNGYQATHYSTYDSNKMILPVMVSGYNGDTGHTWVIDSKKRYSSIMYDKYEKDDGYDIWRIYVEKHEDTGSLYVHCNWGWGGYSDGWFLNNAFYISGQFDYTQNLEMLNIQPK